MTMALFGAAVRPPPHRDLLLAICVAALATSAASGYDKPPPPRPAFKYATELTPDSFVELVQEVANNTENGKSAEYLPLVMFHVSWCHHCRHSLPEFEEAAKTVEEARRAGQLAHLASPPKFFLIECDTGPAAKELCEGFTGTNFPAIKLFRDHRAVRFNRPRTSRAFAWWAMHASRPMITMLESAQHLAQVGEHSPAFVMKAEMRQQRLLEAWGQVALDFLEDYNFYIVQPHSEAGKLMPGSAPTVTIRGSGLDPLPFVGDINRETLKAWANFNRFQPITALSEWSIGDLLGCKLPVVAFVHSGTADSAKAVAGFEDIAKDLRTSAEYIFATVNMSDSDTKGYLKRTFPLVSEAPRIFIFNGDKLYWEDPSFVDLKSLTHERLSGLVASEEARQDGSWFALFKEKRKMIARLATSSFLGAAIVIGVPSLGASCCWLCIRELMRGDDIEDENTVKKED